MTKFLVFELVTATDLNQTKFLREARNFKSCLCHVPARQKTFQNCQTVNSEQAEMVMVKVRQVKVRRTRRASENVEHVIVLKIETEKRVFLKLSTSS